MDVLTILALACWAIFLIVMVAAALFTKRTSVRQSLASRAAYGVPLVIAFLLFVEGMSTLRARASGSGNRFILCTSRPFRTRSRSRGSGCS